jgi:hypothetical protein
MYQTACFPKFENTLPAEKDTSELEITHLDTACTTSNERIKVSAQRAPRIAAFNLVGSMHVKRISRDQCFPEFKPHRDLRVIEVGIHITHAFVLIERAFSARNPVSKTIL